MLLSLVVSRASVLGLQNYVVASGLASRGSVASALAAPAHAQGVALGVAVVLWALVGLGLGLRDPRLISNRLEQLLALPAAPGVAVGAELGERALGQPLLWMTVWPLLTVALFTWGWGNSALLVAVPLTAVHAITLAALEFCAAALLACMPQTLAATLRSGALGLGLLVPVGFLGVVAQLAHEPAEINSTLIAMMAALAPIALVSPAGLGLRPLQAGTPDLDSWLPVLTSALVWGVAAFAASRLADRGREGVAAYDRGGPGRRSVLLTLPGAIAEEFLVVARDRSALTVNVLVPLTLLAVLSWYGRVSSDASPGFLNALPVLIGALFVLPAAGVLPRLGEAVWLLFTVSRPLTRIVLSRACVWLGAGLLAGAVAFAVGGPACLDRSGVALVVGMPALAIAAASLGILSLDPGPGSSRRLSVEGSATLACLVIALGLAAASPLREHVVLLAFLAGAAAALWQRACGHVPWLLDPAGRGPRPLDAADGLKALVLYYALQVMLSGSLQGTTLGGWHLTPAAIATVSGPLAGAMALGLTIDPLVKQGLPLSRILPWFGRTSSQARVLGSAAVLGVFIFALGQANNALLGWMLGGSGPGVSEHPAAGPLREDSIFSLTFALTAVVLGPAVEEIVFRALLQKGLRSTLGPRPALFLATLSFALMHEPQDWGIVLAAGLFLAWFFERTGHLGAVILAHAVNNGIEVAARLLKF